jgi:1-acyl-sn-glycerol-3-phosphate acyltransferase
MGKMVLFYQWFMNLHAPIKSWKHPPEIILKSVYGFILWLLPVTSNGLENIPPGAKKILFVANHQRCGAEALVIVAYMYLKKGIVIRALTDKMFGTMPIVKHILYYFGAAVGSRENCSAIMDSHAPILVFPGGSHEVFRTPELPNYTLVWRDRTGFVRMAAEHGYTIIPLSNIGVEDMMPAWISFPMTYVYWLIGDARSNACVKSEIFKDGSPTKAQERLPIPNLFKCTFQRFYISTGPQVVTSGIDVANKEDLGRVQRKVKKAVEDGIRTCQYIQDCDMDRYTSTSRTLWRRLVFSILSNMNYDFGESKKCF